MSKKSQGVLKDELTIAIITYKRPRDLEVLITSLRKLDGIDWSRVIVVDNDKEGSASEVVKRLASEAEYQIEAMPGIVAARNRCLEIWGKKTKYLAFLDDDEWVDVGWLEAMEEAVDRFPDDILWGPVLSVFPSEVPNWIVKGSFIQRPGYENYSTLKWAATNNVVIPRKVFEVLDSPSFDPDFSESGGSDAELFWRASKAGFSIRWVEGAVVSEHVPISRANGKWIAKRLIRYGNVSARLKLRSGSRIKLALLSLLRIFYGCGVVVIDFVSTRHFQARGYEHMMKGIGMLQTCLGSHVKEYKRR